MRSSLIPDSVGQETLLADNPHLDQAAMHTGGQEVPAQAGQGWRPCSAEHVRSYGEIELIDEAAFEQRSKQSRTAFTCDRANLVVIAQRVQHPSKIDIPRFSEM